MGFGGAAAAMIASIKNNNRRKQREPFDNYKSSVKGDSRIPIKPISKTELNKIKTKIKTENKALFKKQLLIFIFISILILTGAIKLIFN